LVRADVVVLRGLRRRGGTVSRQRIIPPQVSDHALLRWLQRRYGLDGRVITTLDASMKANDQSRHRVQA
jgi:hypothetical protein